VSRKGFGLTCVLAVVAVGWIASPLPLMGALGVSILPEGPTLPVIAVLSDLVVVIDPGHGGFDPGVLEGDIEEADLNLAVALKLRDILERAGAVVVMTRTEDVDLVEKGDRERYGSDVRADLMKRIEKVEESGAHLFLSLHCNHFGESRWRGAQTFYNASSEANRILAETIQTELVRVAGETDRQANGQVEIFILKHVTVPAAVIEFGFLSNPRDLKLLQDESYQQLLAMAVFFGLCRYTRLPPGGPR